jgi:hypothetical protein
MLKSKVLEDFLVNYKHNLIKIKVINLETLKETCGQLANDDIENFCKPDWESIKNVVAEVRNRAGIEFNTTPGIDYSVKIEDEEFGIHFYPQLVKTNINTTITCLGIGLYDIMPSIQENICTCPAENFTWNPIGCKCGAFQREQNAKKNII